MDPSLKKYTNSPSNPACQSIMDKVKNERTRRISFDSIIDSNKINYSNDNPNPRKSRRRVSTGSSAYQPRSSSNEKRVYRLSSTPGNGNGPGDSVNLEYRNVEEWLDSHSDFVVDYFQRKASRAMVDSWLLRQAFSSPRDADSLPGSVGSGSPRPDSGTNTPNRLISAGTSELQLLIPDSRIMSTDVDGNPSFINTDDVARKSPRIMKSSRSLFKLSQLDDRQLMLELIKDIQNDLDLTNLCHKILQNVIFLTAADRSSLFLVTDDGNRRSLVSKVFDVSSESTANDMSSDPIVIPWGAGIVGYVAQTGEVVNIADAYQDDRFNKTIDYKTGYCTRSLLCIPVKNHNGDVIGVAQVINKNGRGSPEAFTEVDLNIFQNYLVFCGIGINNAILYEQSIHQNKRSQLLLELAKDVFDEQSTLPRLVTRISIHLLSLLSCQRCSVYIVENPTVGDGIFSQVFDLDADELSKYSSDIPDSIIDSKFPVCKGITTHVALTGETLNIPDAYAHPRFDQAADSASGFRTKALLYMPIRNQHGEIVGVTQLVNKLDGSCFNKNDEHFFEAFAIFCGLGINNTRRYESSCRAVAKQSVALDVLRYHAVAAEEEARRFSEGPVPSGRILNLHDLRCNDIDLKDTETLQACLRMFVDLDFVETFSIDYRTLCRWLLSVRKNYRKMTYHNWRHAFSVSQFMYAALRATGLHKEIGQLETMVLIVACLCHDLDHRGTNNSFQKISESPLAKLYSTSPLERHHFDHALIILNSKGCSIWENLDQDTHSRAVKILEHAILATDLSYYFKNRETFFSAVNAGLFNINSTVHRGMLRSMLMTASDLCHSVKPWDLHFTVSNLVASEFFDQGDIEKKMNFTPVETMDRDKKGEMPRLQVDFIEVICLPLYESLVKLWPSLHPILSGCRLNHERWVEMQSSVPPLGGFQETGVS